VQSEEKRFIINPTEGTLWIGYQKKEKNKIKTAFTYAEKKKMFI